MDFVAVVLSVLLFAAFVPGVLVTLPKTGSKATVLIVHAVLFAVVTHFVMQYYWRYKESMSNYGGVCPNGYVLGMSKTGVEDCVPAGHPTYGPGAPKSKTE
jgi:hypothetical protein